MKFLIAFILYSQATIAQQTTKIEDIRTNGASINVNQIKRNDLAILDVTDPIRGVRLPIGSEANRPVTPVDKLTRWNADTQVLEFWDNLTMLWLPFIHSSVEDLTDEAITRYDGATWQSLW
jgi:hypothetical protein